MSGPSQTAEPLHQPIRAPGVVVFAILTALLGLAWLRIGWVLASGRFQPAIPKEVHGHGTLLP